MKANLYPFIFEPITKERIWGGVKLKSLLNKNISSETTGESWELSSVSGDISIVKNGVYQGKSLNEIIATFPEEILGTNVVAQFGQEFPLLFKFIDAKEDLSIQVHPNDELAKVRHNSFGKTEMWYVIQADEGAKLIVGFKDDASKEEYIEHLEKNALLSILDEIPVQKGDVFFLETGTVHSIGAGTVIAEIQQTSDITYRLYDFNRKDANGNLRELHIDLALDAINYKKISAKKDYTTLKNESNVVVNCPYFTTNVIPLNGVLTKVNTGTSFYVYMCTEGSFKFLNDGQTFEFTTGDTVLIPAQLTNYQLEGSANLLEITIS